MKFIIKMIANRLILASSSFLSKITIKKNKQSALILAPSWEGSIGDEAVIDAISYQLKQKGFKTTLIHFGKKREWPHLKSIDNWYNISKYFKTGGWIDHFKFINLFLKHSHFYTMGTDMMDGCYAEWLTNGLIKITNHAAHAGLRTTIAGFSINSWQNKVTLTKLEKLHSKVRFCLRDNISEKRFNQLLPRRSAKLTADMAFLLQPTQIEEHIRLANKWIECKKKDKYIVIGININPQLFNDEAKTKVLIGTVIKSLRRIKEENLKYCFLLIPHDFREYNSDVTLLQQVYDALKPDFKSDIHLIRQSFLASDMKGLVKHIDVILSARMHLAIACLGQGTPIGCLVYQGKFEGLFSHFNLSSRYFLNPEKALNEEIFISFIKKIIEERSELKKTIISMLPKVKEKSLANL